MNTKYIKPENYIVIQGFMLSDLALKGAELLVYATIYGFCQTEGQYFSGSLDYLSEWTNCTTRGVSKCLKSLVEKDLICEVSGADGKRIGYTVTNVQPKSEQSSHTAQTSRQSLDRTGTKFQTSEQSSDQTGTKFQSDRNKVPIKQEQSSDKQEQSSEKQEQSSEKQEQSSADNIDNIIYYNNINNTAHANASDVYTRYENLIGNLISENIVNAIDSYIADGIEPEVIIAAIDDAEAANVRRWSYVNKILLDKLSRNIKTLREYKLDRQRFEQSRTNRYSATYAAAEVDKEPLGCLDESCYTPDPDEKARYLSLYGGTDL